MPGRLSCRPCVAALWPLLCLPVTWLGGHPQGVWTPVGVGWRRALALGSAPLPIPPPSFTCAWPE
eukprot:13401092-Alexandrium_andersonii.AAC.1